MEYLIKCNINLIMFYMVYLIVFRNASYFVHNRIYLLATPLISFILPVLNFSLPAGNYVAMLPEAFIFESNKQYWLSLSIK
ncbi:MAG: hypothetical protein H7296_03445 [Bacteroidia bacterium]|nr:hypothetical protein [Bacteroidia bacterium]